MSRFAILLMSLGMGLLAVFLGLFLQKTWADEAETLKREAGLLFVNTVQGVQQEVFDQLIVRRLVKPEIMSRLCLASSRTRRLSPLARQVATMLTEQATALPRG